MDKVKPALVSQYRQDENGFKSAFKAYNNSGYKVFTCMIFGDAAV